MDFIVRSQVFNTQYMSFIPTHTGLVKAHSFRMGVSTWVRVAIDATNSKVCHAWPISLLQVGPPRSPLDHFDLGLESVPDSKRGRHLKNVSEYDPNAIY